MYVDRFGRTIMSTGEKDHILAELNADKQVVIYGRVVTKTNHVFVQISVDAWEFGFLNVN